jgi:hypothetical protein
MTFLLPEGGALATFGECRDSVYRCVREPAHIQYKYLAIPSGGRIGGVYGVPTPYRIQWYVDNPYGKRGEDECPLLEPVMVKEIDRLTMVVRYSYYPPGIPDPIPRLLRMRTLAEGILGGSRYDWAPTFLYERVAISNTIRTRILLEEPQVVYRVSERELRLGLRGTFGGN